MAKYNEALCLLSQRPHHTICNNDPDGLIETMLMFYTEHSDTTSLRYLYRTPGVDTTEQPLPSRHLWYKIFNMSLFVANPIVSAVLVPVEFAKRFFCGVAVFYPRATNDPRVSTIKKGITSLGFSPLIFHRDHHLKEQDLLAKSRSLPVDKMPPHCCWDTKLTKGKNACGNGTLNIEHTDIFGDPYVAVKIDPFIPEGLFCITFMVEGSPVQTQEERVQLAREALSEFYLELWYPLKLRKVNPRRFFI